MALPDGSTRMTTEAVLTAALSYIQDLSSEVGVPAALRPPPPPHFVGCN